MTYVSVLGKAASTKNSEEPDGTWRPKRSAVLNVCLCWEVSRFVPMGYREVGW